MLDDLMWNLQVTVEHVERAEKELIRAKEECKTVLMRTFSRSTLKTG
jgi:hypothetical protein